MVPPTASRLLPGPRKRSPLLPRSLPCVAPAQVLKGLSDVNQVERAQPVPRLAWERRVRAGPQQPMKYPSVCLLVASLALPASAFLPPTAPVHATSSARQASLTSRAGAPLSMAAEVSTTNPDLDDVRLSVDPRSNVHSTLDMLLMPGRAVQGSTAAGAAVVVGYPGGVAELIARRLKETQPVSLPPHSSCPCSQWRSHATATTCASARGGAGSCLAVLVCAPVCRAVVAGPAGA